MQASGILPDYILWKITCQSDLNIGLYYFKERADRTESASYQAQINAVLREVMVRGQA